MKNDEDNKKNNIRKVSEVSKTVDKKQVSLNNSRNNSKERSKEKDGSNIHLGVYGLISSNNNKIKSNLK